MIEKILNIISHQGNVNQNHMRYHFIPTNIAKTEKAQTDFGSRWWSR